MREAMAISVDGVSKWFGAKRVLHDVSLTVRPGEICGLLGRNGSGKTTLMKILLGVEGATHGAAAVLGCDSRRLRPGVKGRIGYVAEGHELVGGLRVGQVAALNRGLARRWDGRFLEDLLGRMRLPVDRKVRTLSNGQRAQLALALALAAEPELLILDDPTLGLDTVVRREFLELAIDLIQREGRTILIASHILSDVERLADHIVMLHDERVVVDTSLEGLKASVQRVRLVWDDEAPERLPVEGLVCGERAGREWLITVANVDARKLAMLAGLGARRVEPVAMGLEEIFVAYTGGGRGEAA